MFLFVLKLPSMLLGFFCSITLTSGISCSNLLRTVLFKAHNMPEVNVSLVCIRVFCNFKISTEPRTNKTPTSNIKCGGIILCRSVATVKSERTENNEKLFKVSCVLYGVRKLISMVPCLRHSERCWC